MKLPLAAIALSVAVLSFNVAARAEDPSPYVAKCQMCHGATGLADTPAGKAMGAHPFNSPDIMKETDAALTAIIKNGKGKMPAFSGKLTDAQIAAMLTTIHKFQK